MNKLFSVFCLSAVLSTTPAMAHEDHGKAMHGGLVAEAGHAQFEIVARDGRLTVHVSNHGTPVATVGASGKLSVLVGTAKYEIPLQPSGDNRFTGTGELPEGARLLLVATWPGNKPMQARLIVPKAAGGHAGH